MVKKILYAVAAIIIFVLLAREMSFTVDETKYAIVIQFGKPVRIIKEPGLQWKFPAPIQTVITFEKRLLLFDPKPSEFLTSDKKNVIVDSFLCWKIKDPQKFLQTVNDLRGAEIRLADILTSEIGSLLGKHPLSELVSIEPEKVKVSEIMSIVLQRCRETSSREYGIEVVDVKMKRLNLPPANKDSVFKRMRTEREQMAKKYRAEGHEEAMKIRAEANKQKAEILSKAYTDSQKIMGEGDAKAIKIYAGAYEKNTDFYSFVRTLEAYKKFLDGRTTVVLSSDSKLLKLLIKGEPVINGSSK